VSSSLDLGETPSYLVSQPDPICLHMALVMSGGLWLWVSLYQFCEYFN